MTLLTTFAGLGSSGPAGDLTTGQIAYWHMEGLTDSSGNAHTLTNNGAVSFLNNGQVLKCATFDGSNQLEIAAVSAAAFHFDGAAFTIGFVWSLAVISDSATLFENSSGGNAQQFLIGTLSNSIYVAGSDTNGDPIGLTLDTNLANPGNNGKVLTIASFNPLVGTNGTLYIRSGRMADSALNAQLSTALEAPLGGPADGDLYFKSDNGGKIDEVLVFNRVLSTADQDLWFTNVKAGNVPV